MLPEDGVPEVEGHMDKELLTGRLELAGTIDATGITEIVGGGPAGGVCEICEVKVYVDANDISETVRPSVTAPFEEIMNVDCGSALNVTNELVGFPKIALLVKTELANELVGKTLFETGATDVGLVGMGLFPDAGSTEFDDCPILGAEVACVPKDAATFAETALAVLSVGFGTPALAPLTGETGEVDAESTGATRLFVPLATVDTIVPMSFLELEGSILLAVGWTSLVLTDSDGGATELVVSDLDGETTTSVAMLAVVS